MTKGNSQGISSVIGPRNVVKTEQKPDHFLNLAFFSIAITSDSLLHLCRFVLKKLGARLRHCQQHYAARMAHSKGSARVLGKEKLLDRNGMGSMAGQQIA